MFKAKLIILIFIYIAIDIQAELTHLNVYTCRRNSEVFIDDSLIGFKNVQTDVEPGLHRITVRYKGHSVTDTIIVPSTRTYSHTQIAAGITVGVDLGFFVICHPLTTNLGISFSPVFTIHDYNLFGVSVAYHTKTFFLLAPSALYFYYYRLFPLIKNHHLGIGFKVGCMITGWRNPGTSYYMDLGFPDDWNIYYLAPSIMLNFGKRPFQFSFSLDALLGTRSYMKDTKAIFASAFRSDFRIHIDF